MRLCLTLATTLAACAMASAPPAQAAYVHNYVGQLTGLQYAYSVAVDDQTGDTLVADSGPDDVKVFDSAGSLIATWNGSAATNAPGTPSGSFGGTQVTVAANNATGDVYVTDSQDAVVDVLSSAGAYLGQLTGVTFSSPRGIAVDQATGDVYVADPNMGVVDVFNSSGVFLSTLTGHSLSDAFSVAVDDQSGEVLVADSGTDKVYVYSAGTGAYLTTWDGSAVANPPGVPGGKIGPHGDIAVAADNSTGHVYVTDTWNDVVDEFSASGNYLSQLTGTPSGNFGNPYGIGVGQATGNVYVADINQGVVDIFNSLLVPDVTTDSATSVTPTTATLNGTVNPDGVAVTSCQFDYGTSSAYGQSVPCAQTPAQIGSGSSPAAVSADVSGLTPGVDYHFRLVAGNANGTNTGKDLPFGPPTVDSEYPTAVTTTSATLQGTVNPVGDDTTCVFQYVDDATFQSSGYTAATSTACTPADLGSGYTDQSATTDVSGLQPGTTYHFRVLATSSAGTTDGADRLLHTYAPQTAGLPDGRGYEMVSPPQKNSQEVRTGISGVYPAGVDGTRVVYASTAAFPGSQTDGGDYLATRGASGWLSENMIPPQSTDAAPECPWLGARMVAFSPDDSKGILLDGGQPFLNQTGDCGVDDPPLVSDEPLGHANLFVRDNTTSAYQLVDVTPPDVASNDATFDAGSADLSHVVFDEDAQLTANAPSGDELYEWTGGAVRLVTVLPDGTAASGTIAGGAAGQAFHAVSDDGSRIFFQTDGNLYVRENGTTTVQVDASQAGGSGGGGQFMDASSDGSTVFFLDAASAGLTNDTVSGSGTNLYEYDLTSGTLTDLTPASQAQVQGFSGSSDDGSYLYFVAAGNLATGATAGQPNLYVWHNGATTFIATLNSGDRFDWTSQTQPGMPSQARASSNGEFIAFDSTQSLTGYDNTDANTGSPDPEIFLYDATANQLSCASCSPSGAPPIRPSSGGTLIYTPEYPIVPQEGGVARAEYFPRQVSDSGQVFFDTPEALVPQDINGQEDVYEYESGVLHLISSGTSDAGSYFDDATPSGSDVFFTTYQQLVPQDTDTASDLYDARVGGGFPASAPPPSCQGDNCYPSPTAAPPVPVAVSVTFTGPGNPATAAPRAAKVRVLRRTIKGTTIKLRVKVPRKGRITISGTGLRTVSRWAPRSGSYIFKAGLTAREKTALRHKRKLKLRIRVSYAPATGSASTAVLKLTINR